MTDHTKSLVVASIGLTIGIGAIASIAWAPIKVKPPKVVNVIEQHFDIEDAILKENQDLKLELNYMQNVNLELIKTCHEE